MTTDRFGRSPEQVKSDQRKILEEAYRMYPGTVSALSIRKDTATRLDIHDLIDHGLLDLPPSVDRRGVVGDETFVPLYRLSVRGLDQLRDPHWLDRHYPRVVNVHAVGSSVNINSPNASATTETRINVLIQLKSEIERSTLPAEEKAGLLAAIEKLSRHPLVVLLLAKLLSGG